MHEEINFLKTTGHFDCQVVIDAPSTKDPSSSSWYSSRTALEKYFAVRMSGAKKTKPFGTL